MNDPGSHSSIGEVLTLLQVEYPDVTISKIRFLESQGLLNPERTPSGYRKFHEEDVERLRWILTQQRDHFLPLKVIKERLAAGDFSEGPPEGVLPLVRPSGHVTAESADVSQPSASTDSEGQSGASESLASGAQIVSAPAGSVTSESGSPVANDSATSVEPSGAGTTSEEVVAGSASSAKNSGSNDRARAVSSLVEGPSKASDPEPPVSRGRKRHPTGHTKGDPTPAADTTVEPDLPAVTLTREELCSQSGLTPAAVSELERFDLLKARSMGPVEYYDDDALTVARLAAGFGRFGIEPRHLRMYKVSAEREAGLFEQLITPLLKQRRAAARDQAVEMLEELAELADDLRAVMVRVSLQEYLGQS